MKNIGILTFCKEAKDRKCFFADLSKEQSSGFVLALQASACLR
jgi:hypothetical protein